MNDNQEYQPNKTAREGSKQADNYSIWSNISKESKDVFSKIAKRRKQIIKNASYDIALHTQTDKFK